MPPLAEEDGSLQSEHTTLLAEAGHGSMSGIPKREPVGLLETLKLAFTSPRMALTIPVILYNGMRSVDLSGPGTRGSLQFRAFQRKVAGLVTHCTLSHIPSEPYCVR